MKIAYQIATPDVRPAPGVTAYQGDMEEGFKLLQKYGYDGAELMVCNPVTVDADKVISLSENYCIEIPMVCTGEIFGQDGLSFSSLDDGVRNEALKRARDAVDLAKKLNSKINVGRLRGGYSFRKSKDICRERSVSGLREIAEYAYNNGVIVALEPNNSMIIDFINTTQEGLAMVEEIDCPSFKLMIDSNHMYIDDKDMIASIYEAKDVITYVHVVDSNRRYPGNCKLDFQAFLHALKEIGYDDYISVEVFQRPDEETVMSKSIEYLRPFM